MFYPWIYSDLALEDVVQKQTWGTVVVTQILLICLNCVGSR
jgi:hypothetical protein